MTKPLLLLDVDGPLNPFGTLGGKLPEGYTEHVMRPGSWTATQPLKVRLNPSHGPSLLSLGFELVWATTWKDEANEWIGPHIGLPELEVIQLMVPWKNKTNLCWKTAQIVEWAAGRDFVWIDDDVTVHDADYIDRNHDGFGGILKVSPKIGLIDRDFAELSNIFKLITEDEQ